MIMYDHYKKLNQKVNQLLDSSHEESPQPPQKAGEPTKDELAEAEAYI